ncbi:hypothetical protein FHL15_002787 [Xylaria flabelliformis]|uniref:Uncharacterized protein n=1 Tax=Xylaria flabelliformis TaxID=2512241 RepID=A0A553I8I5_9PEZI|nr:hypothetical protein FHL15_002787 [Xylaria flabelliformis]
MRYCSIAGTTYATVLRPNGRPPGPLVRSLTKHRPPFLDPAGRFARPETTTRNEEQSNENRAAFSMTIAAGIFHLCTFHHKPSDLTMVLGPVTPSIERCIYDFRGCTLVGTPRTVVTMACDHSAIGLSQVTAMTTWACNSDGLQDRARSRFLTFLREVIESWGLSLSTVDDVSEAFPFYWYRITFSHLTQSRLTKL